MNSATKSYGATVVQNAQLCKTMISMAAQAIDSSQRIGFGNVEILLKKLVRAMRSNGAAGIQGAILLCITATSVAAHAKKLFLNKQRNVDCPAWTLPFKILMVFLWSKRSLNGRIHTVANWFFTNLTWELHDGQASDFSAPGRPRLKACCRSTDCKLHRICSSFHCSRASRRFSECQKAWMNR